LRLNNIRLYKHCKLFCTLHPQVFYKQVTHAIELCRSVESKGIYTKSGRLVTNKTIGHFWESQKNQWRYLPRKYPNQMGRPDKDHIKVLVSFLASAYASKVKKPTLNQDGCKKSDFELFVTPILSIFRISNPRRWIKDHFKNRLKQ